MSAIFYSQVNGALQTELITRGYAGTSNRTGSFVPGSSKSGIDYMLSRITNVEILAYDSRPTPESKPMPNFGVLGGIGMQLDSHLPSGPNGFLSGNRPAYRTTPGIADVQISLNDTSRSFINKAVVTILIPDATTDLDEMETIYCTPGRHIQIRVAQHDDAVLTGGLLDVNDMPNTKTLRDFYPNIMFDDLRKMNEVYFQGQISNFSYNYNSNGSVNLTIDVIGTSNTYGEMKIIMNNTTQTEQTGSGGKSVENRVGDLYADLAKHVDDRIKAQSNSSTILNNIEIINDGTTDQGILVGSPYVIGDNPAPEALRMISLGYLINYVNQYLLQPIGASIICSDKVCKSNFYDRLVSSDPFQILLWSGQSGVKTSDYSYDYRTEDNPTQVAQLKLFPRVQPKSPGFVVQESVSSVAYPSRIYINLSTIQKIVEVIRQPNRQGKVDDTLRNFLNTLSFYIRETTGNAINMVLVQDPIVDAALLYYDANYLGGETSVTEFTMPIFATKTGRSVVRDFNLTSNVPNSVKQLIFGLNAGDAETLKQVAYNPYIYADGETKKKLEEEWKVKHEKALKQLAEAKVTFAKRPKDAEAQKILSAALQFYCTHFTPDIKKSIERTKAVFPMEAECTLDGINGFRYGDVLNFDGLPSRYTQSFVFTILGISHEISDTGQWITRLKCNPRVRIL